jgi:TetR/AcrR family transcriptional repressor of mexJK operon
MSKPPRTRGSERPTGGRPAKREELMRAATAHFLRHGYLGARVDAIAAEAGVSKQTLYNHFGDKQRLFRAVLQEAGGGAPFDLDLVERVGDSDDLGADLLALGHDLVHGALDDEVAALRRLLVSEWDRMPAEIGADWARVGIRLLQTLTEAIERQRGRGLLDVHDAALAARQFVLLTATDAHTRALQGRRPLAEEEREQVVHDGVALWLRAYGPR